MRTIVAAAVVASVFTSSAFAADPFNDNGWQRSRPPAAVAYFKMNFHAKAADKVAYGLAVTAPTPRRYGAAPLSIADMPKLADLRFNGAVPQTLRLSNQLAWSIDPSAYANEGQHNLLGVPGVGGALFGLALTAGAVYGIYTVVKKNCPAISTTSGGCVQPAN